MSIQRPHLNDATKFLRLTSSDVNDGITVITKIKQQFIEDETFSLSLSI
jgi:hypothetical protein